MKREKQINDSKEMILNGLTLLLDNHPINSITMTAIANKAQVTRMTLYRHFKCKEDIILFGFERNLDYFILNYPYSHNPKIFDILLFRFKAIKESPYSKLLLENDYIWKLFRVMRQKTYTIFEKNKLIDQFTLDFIGGGMDAITEQWMLDGMKTPYDEIANRTFKILLKLST